MKPEIGMPVWFHATATERRPAVIVQQWGDSSGEDKINLVVTIDGSNDARHGFSAEECARCSAWRASVKRTATILDAGAAREPGTWSYRP